MNRIQSNTTPIILTGKHFFLDDDCACPDSPQIFTSLQDTFENDCACPSADSADLANLLPADNRLYKQADSIYRDDLSSDFRLAFSPYAPQGPSVLNLSAWERWQNFAQPRPLSQPEDAILAQQNLIMPVTAPARLPTPIPEMLTAWMHVTNACNLDCPYCYVRKSSASMTEEIGLNAIGKIFQTASKRQFKNVKLKYAGGEATLQFRLLKKLAEHAEQLSQEYGLGLKQVILSNGTRITVQDAAWMLENNLRLMISLDGVGEIHDRTRPYRNGNGSFDAVRRTIDEVLLPGGLSPMITVTITQQNAGGAADAVRWALERDLSVSLNFYRHKPDSAEDLAAEENTLIDGMLAAYQVYEEVLPLRPFLNGLLDRTQAGGHLHTCGVGSSYLVINHEGALAQCQMQLDAPVSRALTDDLLLQVHNGPLKNISVEEKQNCNTCTYRYRCAGGCPLETYRASGRWDVSSPNCHIYKTLFPHAFRLEGLRLLKMHGWLN
ncbi:MAG: hypothetical protein HFACDABA_01678 [Anaerolineales bacterium]|nr:hypothetical protein [Anaerolineales bacterium]